MLEPIRRHRCSRKALQCSFYVLLLLVLVLTGVLASGSRVRSRKHRSSHDRSPVSRWQSRSSSDGTSNTIHEVAAKPAPFSKPAHAVSSGPKKRSYYVPTVTNLENNLHHFINNLKTSKLAHAVNGVSGAIQQAVSLPGHGSVNLVGSHRPVSGLHGPSSYYANANELRYGQPFVSKQASGHFKSSSGGYGKKPGHHKRGRHPTASPPGKYDSLMSDLGISGYKHFENAVIRDLERREELKVEATIHTLFPEDEDWRPIAASKKPTASKSHIGVAELSESKIVPALVVPPEKRPLESGTRTTRVKPSTSTIGTAGRPGGLTSPATGPKTTTTPGSKHRSKGSPLGKTKRPKPDKPATCWNCVGSSSSTSAPRQPVPATTATTSGVPSSTALATSTQRFGPSYDATMFYGNDGKPPAAIAQSYSNVEIQYNHTQPPPFVGNPWTVVTTGGSGGLLTEVSTQPAPPVTTFSAQTIPGFYASGIKKSFSKAVKPYLAKGDTTVASAPTHKPTGGSQGPKGTTKKRTTHRQDARKPADNVGAGSSKSELRVRKKFDSKYSRNRGSIKFKDALERNPDQIYR
ncbi:uncharacterized protein LOC128721872 [Anopheles nili]|uniref:uncharacterized protein LOC128721872 n=1 Tax=Anopheles nili TaxID=185578 RepID=UPI00237B80AE|nr:uncharacterized protein LOC128721872 [Anopheles nili]